MSQLAEYERQLQQSFRKKRIPLFGDNGRKLKKSLLRSRWSQTCSKQSCPQQWWGRATKPQLQRSGEFLAKRAFPWPPVFSSQPWCWSRIPKTRSLFFCWHSSSSSVKGSFPFPSVSLLEASATSKDSGPVEITCPAFGVQDFRDAPAHCWEKSSAQLWSTATESTRQCLSSS